jgi:hypothetical protein
MSESKDSDTSWQEDEFFDLTTGQIMRDRAAFETNQREREVRALIDARIAQEKHEIAVRITTHIMLLAMLLAFAGLDGMPVFTVTGAWFAILFAMFVTLSQLWGWW